MKPTLSKSGAVASVNPATTLRWLLQREIWEHKGMLVWAPLVVGAVMLLFAALALLHAPAGGISIMHDNGAEQTVTTFHMDASSQAYMVGALSRSYVVGAAPLFAMLGFLVFFYCLGALFNERADRSMLFWKSLPVSDGMTVASKAVLALVVAPLITCGIALVVSLIGVLVMMATMAFYGVNAIGDLLTTPAFYTAPLYLVSLLPVYILWALPTVGWLLMVSAWARSKVFLWAVGAPLIATVLAAWGSRMFGLGWDMGWVMHNVIGRILIGVAPGSWMIFDRSQIGALLEQTQQHPGVAIVAQHAWNTLAGPAVWIGALAGLAMLGVAVWLRRWRDEG